MMKTVLFTLLIVTNAISQTPGSGLIDIDGNIYNTVIIGEQEWTTENLAVTKYSNGEAITQQDAINDWTGHDSAWCYYQNNPSNGPIYGKLYRGSVLTDPRGLAPEGWHIPSNAEWDALILTLGGATVAGGQMKSTVLWNSPNTGATNSFGFSALPGMLRRNDGSFPSNVGEVASWWSSSYYGPSTGAPYVYHLRYDSAAIVPYYIPASAGASVRLVKNNPLATGSIQSHSIKIYPNPTNDELQIGSGSEISSYNVQIINVMGQTIAYQNLRNGNIISLKRFGSGVYFVKIYDSLNYIIETHKIIVK